MKVLRTSIQPGPIELQGGQPLEHHSLFEEPADQGEARGQLDAHPDAVGLGQQRDGPPLLGQVVADGERREVVVEATDDHHPLADRALTPQHLQGGDDTGGVGAGDVWQVFAGPRSR